jgi:hypothetical protein
MEYVVTQAHVSSKNSKILVTFRNLLNLAPDKKPHKEQKKYLQKTSKSNIPRRCECQAERHIKESKQQEETCTQIIRTNRLEGTEGRSKRSLQLKTVSRLQPQIMD